MRKALRILLIYTFFSMLGVSFALAQMEMRISPPVVDLTVGRGGTKVFSFELVNDNKERTLVFSVGSMDLDVDRAGAPVFLPSGSVPFGCGKWLQAEPAEVTIGTKQSKKIVGKLSVPASAPAGGYYGAIVCELVDKNAPKLASGSLIKWQIACLVKVSVEGGKLEKKASIEDFQLMRLFETAEEENKGLTFTSALKNLGNIHIAVEGKLTVLTPERIRKGEVAFNVGSGTILPGHVRDFTAVYDKLLPEGEYIARATFRYGGIATLEKEMPFTVSAKASPGQSGAGDNVAAVSVVKIKPDKLKFKIPAGGFRTTGVLFQNQSSDSLRVRLQVDQESSLKTWFDLDTEEAVIPSGREVKILLRCSIPQDSKPQNVSSSITVYLATIDPDGRIETLDPQKIGIELEIPKF